MKNNISVVIPVYNGGKTIARALASLISSKDYIKEIIVVNDNSTDDTINQVKPFMGYLPVKIINSEGVHNPSVARKTGLLCAGGEWITFIDADDCLTASSLYYVNKFLEEDDNLVLLHCQTIYYESGNFVPEDISHSDYSCGGNFYKREYLIENNLLPHESLKMSEDEYFNNKVRKYIEYVDESDATFDYYDYPVYEVHHDIDEEKSFAISHWVDYLIKYHLLAQIYLTEDLIKYSSLNNVLRDEYIDNFIFCYFLLQGLMADETEMIDIGEQKKYFKEALLFFTKKFFEYKKYIIDYYKNNEEYVNTLWEGASKSVGFEFDETLSFEDFVNGL